MALLRQVFSQLNLLAFKSESESFVKIINLVGCVLGLLSVLDTALRAKVLANKQMLRSLAFDCS